MPYIGNSPGTGTRNRFIYTATASQTTFSGADDNGKTLKYADSDYVDVYLNGICLVPVTDYTSTSKTSIVLTQAASLNDTLEVVAYDIATISDTVSKADGGTFEGDLGVTSASPDLTFTNSTSEDTDGGRESTVTFKGKQSGGEESTLAQIQASHDGTSDDEKGDLIFKTNDGSDGASPTERMRIDSAGQTKITGAGNILTVNAASGVAYQNFQENNTNRFFLATLNGADGLAFVDADGSAERMRIDDIGNLNIGSNSNVGYGPLQIGSTSNANTIAQFLSTTSGYGTIHFGDATSGGGRYAGFIQYNHSGNRLNLSSTTTLALMILGSERMILDDNEFYPNPDNYVTLGWSGGRFVQVYAVSGTINTSDRNEKQDIEDLSEAEKRVATAAKGLIKKYRWIDAVQKKGDDARIHVGIIAQDLQAAFESEGLDPHRYGMFCSDTWWEKDRTVPATEDKEEHTVTDSFRTQEEAPEGATERTRLGVRYEELLAFIIGAM